MRNQDLIEQNIANGLCDDRFAVSWRTVDEQGMPGGNSRSKLIKYASTQNEMRKRLFHAIACGNYAILTRKVVHVRRVLMQWYRQRTDVAATFHEQHGTYTSGIRQTVGVGRRAEEC